MKLKLQEIIWEITGKCNNGCAYCGSTDLWFEDIDEDKIKKIADAIAEYPPESLNVSGGDPLLISYATHEYIVNKLTKAKCKILFNPMSLKYATSIGPQAAAQDAATKLKILLLYSHVGVSVNTKGELNQFNNYKFPFPFTVISNFNLTNFFLFDDIATSLSKYPDCCWQIQFTMYKKDDDLGLYNYPEAVAKLNQDIAKYPNLKIVVADNANPGPCSAGIATLGILSSGDVVPCLSMRSWCEPIKVEGNILMNPLKDIWVYNFKENRFEDCICCKDICQRQILKQEAPAKPQKLTAEPEKKVEEPVRKPRKKAAPPTVEA